MCKTCKSCFLEGTYVSHKEQMVVIDNVPDVIINKVSSISAINFEGTIIQVTSDHEVMTPNGWVDIGSLKEGDIVLNRFDQEVKVYGIINFTATIPIYTVFNIKDNGNPIYVSYALIKFKSCE